MRKWLRKRWVRVALVTLVIYLASYAVLSRRGELGYGEIWFTYVPLGDLVESEDWRRVERGLAVFYWPAYQLERLLGSGRIHFAGAAEEVLNAEAHAVPAEPSNPDQEP